MRVLPNTPIWSAALRRAEGIVSGYRAEMTRLVNQGTVEIIGPIRQEILSGIRDHKQFELLKARIEDFPDISLRTRHFELAADFSNQCRKHGILGSHTDFIICSVAHIEKLSIFTVDKDFERYSKYLSLNLHRAMHSSGHQGE